MISAFDSRMKKKSVKIANISIHKRYIGDNIDDNQLVEQTRLLLAFFAILSIYPRIYC